MSKSNADSAIFMEDTAEDVNRKIKGAYAPVGSTENNPIIDYISSIVFPKYGKMTIERSAENGGSVTFNSFKEFVVAYQNEEVHPADVKKSLAKIINALIEPVRKHFATNPKAKALLKKVKEITKKKKK